MRKPMPLSALLLVTLGIVTYLCAATVWIAGWVVLPMLHVPMAAHQDWIWLDYWRAYPDLRRGVVGQAGAISFALSLLPGLLFLTKRKRSLHGDAKFASKRQIVEAGLFSLNGILVGQLGRKYLCFPGQQHVLMDAPTRSGKGVGIVVPNLLSWSDSVVVLDIKQENWNLTAGFRAQHGQACYLFNPAAEDRRTHRYNPLSYISADPAFRINDVQKIAAMIYPDRDGEDPIWTASCRSLFVGIVLYLIETPELPCTLGQVLRTTLSGRDTARTLTGIIASRIGQGRPLSPECVMSLSDFTGVTSENTRSSIQKTFTSRLELWLNPVIDAATSRNDFDLRELRRRRMSLYIGITPDNLDRLKPIINLLIQQTIDLNTRELPQQNPALKFQVLMLMDEFTSIGKVGVLSKGISYVAGYGLRMLPIIQSPAQLREVYGNDAAETFMVNHALRIVFAPREQKVAQEISDTLGFQTVKADSVSRAKNIFTRRGTNISTSDQRRALMLPQELRDLGAENALILLEGAAPIQCRKIRYYNDDTFTSRLLDPPTVPLMALRTTLATVLSSPESPSEAGPAIIPPVAFEPASFEIDTAAPTTQVLTNSSFDAAADESASTDPFADFNLDFSSVKVEEPTISDDELQRLHALFLAEMGVTDGGAPPI